MCVSRRCINQYPLAIPSIAPSNCPTITDLWSYSVFCVVSTFKPILFPARQAPAPLRVALAIFFCYSRKRTSWKCFVVSNLSGNYAQIRLLARAYTQLGELICAHATLLRIVLYCIASLLPIKQNFWSHTLFFTDKPIASIQFNNDSAPIFCSNTKILRWVIFGISLYFAHRLDLYRLMLCRHSSFTFMVIEFILSTNAFVGKVSDLLNLCAVPANLQSAAKIMCPGFMNNIVTT